MIPGFPAFVGVNLPWHVYGCDFGGNAWYPQGGVGRPGGLAALEGLFERLSSARLTLVRWFLFCDGRAGIRFDPGGVPLGLDPYCLRDVDAALALAGRHRLAVLFVLFDFPWFRPRRLVNGATLFGRRAVVARQDWRSALLERVVAELLRRYGAEPLILAWDLVNEPEWATFGYGGWPLKAVPPRIMAGWLGEMSGLVHAEARQPATVGLASPRGLPLVQECGLDFYQVHWYDRLERRWPLATPPLDRVDRPLLLGEFPTAGSALTAAELVATAREAGYAGALAWSAAARDAHSNLAALEKALGAPAAQDLHPPHA